MTEIGAAYAEGRQRVSELVGGLGETEAAAPVPACPEWSVHDVVAHVTGVCADVLAGNLEGVATDPWTDAQVRARKDRSVAEIVAEWNEIAPGVEAMAEHFPGRTGQQWLMDMTTHEQDLRGALAQPGARDSAGIRVGVDFLLSVGLEAMLSARGLGPLDVRAGGETRVVGIGGQGDEAELLSAALYSADAPPKTDSAPMGTLTVEPFELFRAMTGRRSASQVRAWDWSVDPEPYLGILTWGPFTPPAQDLVE